MKSGALLSDDALAGLLDHVAMALGAGVTAPHAWLAVAKATRTPREKQFAETMARIPPALVQRMNGALNAPREAVRAVVLCHVMCESTGAPLSGLLTSLANGLRDSSDAARARSAAFAGAKSTARVLMVLPLFAIGLGYAMGADPLRVLLTSRHGMLMLSTGVLLTAIGVAWMNRMLAVARGVSAEIDPLIVIDLIASVVHSGIPLSSACMRIGEALENTPPGPALLEAGRALARGMPPEGALSTLEGDLAVLTSAAGLSHATGARLAPILSAVTRDRRRARVREVDEASAKLAVRLVLPTGITILPAFVLLGIVPIITDLVTTHFGRIWP
ncbi:type II secretion system F family protein [Dermabacter vaginalis]|uniref:Pilus assembly protein TadB n=1 Tax=Dermabacter vaginalis TaxID=1630135 RepID=A0ABX6A4C8_9MICO|nr:type II secretion system F family protein [Dermabacter vaginalis]QEU11206.1 pilus assembly protein TadB [Dermabacter vaginalis]